MAGSNRFLSFMHGLSYDVLKDCFLPRLTHRDMANLQQLDRECINDPLLIETQKGSFRRIVNERCELVDRNSGERCQLQEEPLTAHHQQFPEGVQYCATHTELFGEAAAVCFACMIGRPLPHVPTSRPVWRPVCYNCEAKWFNKLKKLFHRHSRKKEVQKWLNGLPEDIED